MEHDNLAELAREFKSQSNEVKQIASGIDARLADIEQRQATPGTGFGTSQKSWGEQFASDPRVKAFAENGAGKLRLEMKATVGSGVGSGGSLVTPQIVANDASIALPRNRLSLRSVLLSGTTTSNAIEYPRQNLRTNGAAMVAELAAKPESALGWETVLAPVRTLATLLPASKQIFDDSAVLRSVVDGELRYLLADVEEAQILMGDGTGQNLPGIYTTAAAFSAPFVIATPNMADTILLALAQNANAGYDTDFVVLHPLDIARLLSLKDAEDRYLGSGPFTDSDIIRLWQTPLVASKAMPQGSFLVGSRLGAQVFDRQQPTVEISFDHADFFAKNMVMFRAEQRLALANYRPSSFVKGTFE